MNTIVNNITTMCIFRHECFCWNNFKCRISSNPLPQTQQSDDDRPIKQFWKCLPSNPQPQAQHSDDHRPSNLRPQATATGSAIRRSRAQQSDGHRPQAQQSDWHSLSNPRPRAQQSTATGKGEREHCMLSSVNAFQLFDKTLLFFVFQSCWHFLVTCLPSRCPSWFNSYISIWPFSSVGNHPTTSRFSGLWYSRWSG